MKAMLSGVAAVAATLLAPAAHAAPASIDDYLAEAMRETGLPGLSVVVTQGDRLVHAAGYGEDSEGAPVTADTPMPDRASVSESFTAMAVMTLVEDGRIALDDPVADQLPGFTMAEPRFAT